jgi:hypothetical protein
MAGHDNYTVSVHPTTRFKSMWTRLKARLLSRTWRVNGRNAVPAVDDSGPGRWARRLKAAVDVNDNDQMPSGNVVCCALKISPGLSAVA